MDLNVIADSALFMVNAVLGLLLVYFGAVFSYSWMTNSPITSSVFGILPLPRTSCQSRRSGEWYLLSL